MFIVFWLFNIIVSLITKENEMKILENTKGSSKFFSGVSKLEISKPPF